MSNGPINKQTGISIGLGIAMLAGTVWLTTELHSKVDDAELEGLEQQLRQLSGQLGNLSKSNAGVLEANTGLRRDLDRVERAIERLEERLP